MKLKRNSINLGNEYRGKWYFTIEGNDPEAIEAAEIRLRAMETGSSLGGRDLTWEDYCDGCPCYDDGFGSGFWIEIEEVEAFKAAWKIAKKTK
ncbi:Hypothetical protein KNT65_gp186 [Escherichia phage EcS1]|uniref:Phage protein n=1 Tax=Escherichia phage EcS1 TaxID=2083276 RepID=A0A2Z5ZCU6_9CAUD|nr:Hypothetical protein KNT65_gp186 [Escherichia phage EcS1]BBC78307.1 Hypothetical protein [Escherichia phage EcS1]